MSAWDQPTQDYLNAIARPKPTLARARLSEAEYAWRDMVVFAALAQHPNLSRRALARMLNLTYHTIAHTLRKHGCALGTGKPPNPAAERGAREYLGGEHPSYQAAATAHAVTKSAVAGYIYRLKRRV